MLVLNYHMPAHLRMCNWKLLYTLDRDGYSYINFFERLSGVDETILIVEDTMGHKFGALCTGTWNEKRGFQGDGCSWVFTFHDSEDLKLWPATGLHEMYQHGDSHGLIIGGSDDKKHHSALVIMNDFSGGHSGHSLTYDNEVLCFHNPGSSECADFKVLRFEVWSFDI